MTRQATSPALITQTKPHIEHYIRQPDHRWLLEEAEDLRSTIHFPAIDCHLSLAEAYDKVDIVVVLRYPGSRQCLTAGVGYHADAIVHQTVVGGARRDQVPTDHPVVRTRKLVFGVWPRVEYTQPGQMKVCGCGVPSSAGAPAMR